MSWSKLALILMIAASASAEEIQTSFAGKLRGEIGAHRVAARRYVSAKEIGETLGAAVYWYPVAGRVQMSFAGRSIGFMLDSEEANAAEKRFRLEGPVVTRAGQALIPLSFFLSREFSEWSRLKVEFNPKTGLLSADRMGTVGTVRHFSYGSRSRLLVELAENITFTSARKGRSSFEVSIPGGVIESSESAEIRDGFVASYALRQEAHQARLSVKLQEPSASWKITEMRDPRRIAIDIIADKPAAPARPAAKRRIVIDAGHGGRDSGATGRRGTYEKDINILASKELAGLLGQENVFDVLLTRKDDTLVALADRSRLANEFEADLFISLHCNASSNRRDSGFEIYFLSEKASDPEAERLAEFENSVLKYETKADPSGSASAILVAMTKTEHINEAAELSGLLARAIGRRTDLVNRGVKQADFYVLRGTNAPAVLVEMAYVSHSQDETKLESKRYRRRIVDGVYAGILDYARRRDWLGKAEGGHAPAR